MSESKSSRSRPNGGRDDGMTVTPLRQCLCVRFAAAAAAAASDQNVRTQKLAASCLRLLCIILTLQSLLRAKMCCRAPFPRSELPSFRPTQPPTDPNPSYPVRSSGCSAIQPAPNPFSRQMPQIPRPPQAVAPNSSRQGNFICTSRP